MRQRIILSYGEDEWLPVISQIGCNLKEKNLFFLEYINTVQNGDFKIVHSKLYKDENDAKKMDTFVTYSDKDFVRGVLYMDGKEYKIIRYNVYMSLQIENFCYDNITAIRLSEEVSL